jgi:hypothetical protein
MPMHNWVADLFSFQNEPTVVYDSLDVCAKSIPFYFSASTEQDGPPLPGDILKNVVFLRHLKYDGVIFHNSLMIRC